ncbi:MAG: acyltransferase family protein [Leptolyngbyaceae cyanobacterium]
MQIQNTELKPKFKKKKQRLLGVELMRGVAAFAVVLSHSGDATWGELSRGVIGLRALFSFHVPFFLAISFYFLAQKFLNTPQSAPFSNDLRPRLQRILLPYATWTLIYLAFRSVFFFMEGKSERLLKLYGDFASTLFLGGASYHLYFLPLLFVGTVTFYALNRIFRPWTLPKILGILTVSIAIRALILITGNQFQLGPNIAFQNVFDGLGIDPHGNIILRLLAVTVVWAATCLPFISVALLFSFIGNRLRAGESNIVNRGQGDSSLNPYLLLTLAIAIFLTATFLIDAGAVFRPFQKLIVAFSLVVVALSLSYTIFRSGGLRRELATSLGHCTLGIYLVHPIIIQFVKLGLSATYPTLLRGVSVFSILTISITTFLISWLLISILIKRKTIRPYLA